MDDMADPKDDARRVGGKQKRYSTESIPMAATVAREANEEPGSPDEGKQEEDAESDETYSPTDDLTTTSFQSW